LKPEKNAKTLSDWKKAMKFFDFLLEDHCPSLDVSKSFVTRQLLIQAISEIINHLQRPAKNSREKNVVELNCMSQL
jgi:hypothetical protein